MSDNLENFHAEQTVEIGNEHLQAQLVECQSSLEEWKEKYIRVNADFENFRKRTIKEQALWRQTAQIELLLPLISVVDDFDRALEGKTDAEITNAGLEGFSLIHKSLHKYLQSLGVESMTDYDTFNPEYHEAIMQVDTPSHESGAIVSVLEKGYLFKGIVLRPAKVSVAK